MRPLPEIRGLKFPDEFVVRHFYKRGLAEHPGRVLELGCGAGNNLGLYQAYGWRATGVDYDEEALTDARWNLGEDVELVRADLALGAPHLQGMYDALIIPNLLCYLTRDQAVGMLSALRPNLKSGCEVFVRTRLIDDYRYGRGAAEGSDGFRLETPETGEAGLFNRFYTPSGLLELLRESLRIAEHTALAARFDNVQAGQRVPGNSDLVIWGQTA